MHILSQEGKKQANKFLELRVSGNVGGTDASDIYDCLHHNACKTETLINYFFAGYICILLSIINNHHQELIQVVVSERDWM